MNIRPIVCAFLSLASLAAVAVEEVVIREAAVAEQKHADRVEELEAPRWYDGIWFSANVDFNSHYVWRGTIMNDNPCWQPGAYLGYTHEDYGGLYLGVWTSMDLTHRVNEIGCGSRHYCGMSELDYLIAYTKSFGDFDFELQHWFYTYPNDNFANYNELVFITRYNNDYVTPGAEVWWAYYSTNSDFDPCFWFNFFLLHDFKFFNEKLVITPRASLSFGDAAHQRDFVVDYAGTGADGSGAQLTDQTTTLRVAYNITKYLSVTAHIDFTWVPSKVLREERWMTYGYDDRVCQLWGGVGVALSF